MQTINTMKRAALALAVLAGAACAEPMDLVLADGTRIRVEQVQCEGDACARGAARMLGHASAGTRIAALTLRTGGRAYALDVSEMVDPLVPKIDGFCYDERNCHLRGTFGDGGGVYAAEWQIVDGVATRTVLSGSLDLVRFFRANLKPPRYE